MAQTKLSSQELCTFFESVALMHGIGVQTDEAVFMLMESTEDGLLQSVATRVYGYLIAGQRLSNAMENSGAFPDHAIALVAAGERTGRIEDTLNKLATYYDEEDRLFAKVRASIGYPCVLLCVLSVILAFTVAAILPVFMEVYDSMAGGLATSSDGLATAGLVIGWVAFGITLVVTVLALIAWLTSRSSAGRGRVMQMLSAMPFAREAFYSLALSRFTSALAVYTAAGTNTDEAVGQALAIIDNDRLRRKVQAAYNAMIDPARGLSLVQAFAAADVFDAPHIRALSFGMRAGRIDDVLAELSGGFFDDAIVGFDAMVDRVEPALAGFVTVAVGTTLIAVMLPLIGMMGAIR